MEITIRYFDGCPNWKEAEQRLRTAIAETGADVRLTFEAVETPQDAERLSFRGSPTLLFDGVDPFDDPTAPVGMSLRCTAATSPSGAIQTWLL